MTYSINDLRQIYLWLASRALRARRLLDELSTRRVILDADSALKVLAYDLYHNESFDACFRYESLEDFIEVLREDEFLESLKTTFEGRVCYVLCPVLSDLGVFAHYDGRVLDSLHLGFSELFLPVLDKTLKAERDGTLAALERPSDVSALSEFEASFVAKGYRSLALRLASALRQLRTSLEYTRNEDRRVKISQVVASMDADLFTLLDALYETTDLPGFAPTARHFSWPGSDKVNVVRDFPEDKEAFMAALRDAPRN